ncbi:hypothetical protein LWC08_09130 [Desulfobaculum bizertense]|uniref:hypothetical protein n=1 Tax=Desulfobaculum bizertense TaxID=376490 RepID=UPI001F36C83A|nr:hypothetical protein [Desulfobaculum bizertense]UIJ36902.1 hypothetical protein LWC08_09130 [Desulfobaculum bizertense]
MFHCVVRTTVDLVEPDEFNDSFYEIVLERGLKEADQFFLCCVTKVVSAFWGRTDIDDLVLKLEDAAFKLDDAAEIEPLIRFVKQKEHDLYLDNYKTKNRLIKNFGVPKDAYEGYYECYDAILKKFSMQENGSSSNNVGRFFPNCDSKTFMSAVVASFESLSRMKDRDMFSAFWNGRNRQGETICCKELLHRLVVIFKEYDVQVALEQPLKGNRCDMLFSYKSMRIPVEAKCQDHKELWSALKGQLIEKYIEPFQDIECGIYLVFWFGADGHIGLTYNKSFDFECPSCPEELQRHLQDFIPSPYSDNVSVVCLNCCN